MKTILIILVTFFSVSSAMAESPQPRSKDDSGIYNTKLRSSSLMQVKQSDMQLAAVSTTGKGMTFITKKSLPKNNQYHQSTITTVGCGKAGGHECNAYKGDTACSVKLPVLCFAPVASLTDPSGGDLHQWANGRMKTIGPYRGDSFASQQDVSAACAADLGNANWRVAEFHEHPKGWNWTAFGKAHPQKNFWVHIKDQPANCWK